MKISKVEIHNFKNLESISFCWENKAILIGENNTGKSSVLEALDWFHSGRQIKGKSLFRNENCNEQNRIELIVFYSNLTDLEKESIAVRGRMHNDQWILKKSFWLELENGKENWKECYYSFHETEVFENWPDSARSWNNWPQEYQDCINDVEEELGHRRVNPESLELLKRKVREEKPHLFSTQTGWNPNPGGGGNWKSNANSIIPQFIFIQAVHEITEETQSKDASTYGKIVNLLIEKKLSQRPEYKELSKQIERIKALFTPNLEHPDWKQADEITELENTISNKLSNVIDAKAKIETSDLNFRSVILPATILKIDDGFLTTVSNQGHGLQRTLLITLLQVLTEYVNQINDQQENIIDKSSVVFGIEEPEIYLHPQMIRKMKDVLDSLSVIANYQVIYPTHSSVLLDLADSHKNVVRFEMDEQRKIKVFQIEKEIFSGATAKHKRQQLRMINEFDSSVNELFFAKRVVLVEGDTEIALFQKGADILNLFTNVAHKRNTTFINCRGKGSMLLFIKVLNHFKIKYVVVHDIDKQNDPLNQSIQNEVNGGGDIISFDPNIEQVLGYQSTGNDKPLKALDKLQELKTQDQVPVDFLDKLKKIFGPI